MILTQRQNLVSIRDYSLRLLQTKTLVEIEDQRWVKFNATVISKLDLDFWPNLDFTAKSLHCRAIEVLEKEWQLFSLSLNMQVQCPSEQKKLHPCINNQRNLLHKASYVQNALLERWLKDMMKHKRFDELSILRYLESCQVLTPHLWQIVILSLAVQVSSLSHSFYQVL